MTVWPPLHPFDQYNNYHISDKLLKVCQKAKLSPVRHNEALKRMAALGTQTQNVGSSCSLGIKEKKEKSKQEE